MKRAQIILDAMNESTIAIHDMSDDASRHTIWRHVVQYINHELHNGDINPHPALSDIEERFIQQFVDLVIDSI